MERIVQVQNAVRAAELARATRQPVEVVRGDGSLSGRSVPCYYADGDDIGVYVAYESYARDGFACCELLAGHIGTTTDVEVPRGIK